MKRLCGTLLMGLMAQVQAAPAELSLRQDDVAAISAQENPDEVLALGGGWSAQLLEVYAADASVLRVGADGPHELARSAQKQLRIAHADGKSLGVLTLEADGAFAAATVFEGTSIYVGTAVKLDGVWKIAFADLADSLPPDVSLETECGTLNPRTPALLPSLAPAGASAMRDGDSPNGSLVQARLAIDTDNELLSLKFANNATNASNYVAQLVALMSVIYERDLNVRLMIGTQILRTTTDPYAVNGSSTSAQLNEFSEYWRVNQAAVPRAFSLQLSGKASGDFSAAGIAWILDMHNYCASKGETFAGGTFGHYSVSQVFKFAGATAATDVSLVAHELGHNFGASHTHCTDTSPAQGLQPIDMCFNAETNCYSGAVSCPVATGNQGTLMSYCNFTAPSGAGCGAVRQEFHPVHITQLSARVLANSPGCLTPVSTTPDNIFANGFE